jgi:hypothetical protein
MPNDDDVREVFAIRLLPRDKMEATLHEVFPRVADFSALTEHAGRLIEIFELSLVATFFSGENRLPKVRIGGIRRTEPEIAIMICMVPEDQQERLAQLLKALAAQIG